MPGGKIVRIVILVEVSSVVVLIKMRVEVVGVIIALSNVGIEIIRLRVCLFVILIALDHIISIGVLSIENLCICHSFELLLL